MKRTLLFLMAMAVGGAAAALFVSHQWQTRHAAELAAEQAAWQQERADLESALEAARAAGRVVIASPNSVAPRPPVGQPGPTPTELVARLRATKAGPGPGQNRALRQVIRDLEELIAAGPAALPAIRQFLVRNEDIDFTPGPGRGGRGGVPDEFVVPPSLRFGFFDAVRRIGGGEGEKLLAEVLGTTGRGVELAWLARALQAMAPDQYREAALAAARALLARQAPANASAPDRNDRDQLFSVLAMYGDTSYVSAAQEQLLHSDGTVDRGALKYLEQSLGPQAVTIAAQAYQNPLLLTNAAAKEPLARLALNYVGADPQANDFYQRAINDPILTKGHRKNLIEDLNQDGFADLKNLSARDLPLIQNRLALIEQLAPGATDPVNVAAFKEAYKDLLNMRERITRPPNPNPTP